MNVLLNQLEDRLDRWMEEPMQVPEREIVVVANLLREVVQNLKAIDARLEQSEDTARHAANTASCLANGIQPD